MLNSIPSTRENFAREKFQFICIAGKKSKIFNFDKCYFLEGEKFKLKNPFAQETIVSNREYRQYIFFRRGKNFKIQNPFLGSGKIKIVKNIAPTSKLKYPILFEEEALL